MLPAFKGVSVILHLHWCSLLFHTVIEGGKKITQEDNIVGKIIPLLQCLYHLEKACLISFFLSPRPLFLIAQMLLYPITAMISWISWPIEWTKIYHVAFSSECFLSPFYGFSVVFTPKFNPIMYRLWWGEVERTGRRQSYTCIMHPLLLLNSHFRIHLEWIFCNSYRSGKWCMKWNIFVDWLYWEYRE